MEIVQIILTAGIFLIAFLALLLSGMRAMLNSSIQPVKDNQAGMETEVKEIKSEIKESNKNIENAIITSVDEKMSKQWEILNKRTLADFKELLLSS